MLGLLWAECATIGGLAPTEAMNEKRQTASSLKREERRRQVEDLLSQGYNETEIAEKLGVSISTISRDISELKELSQQFVRDLAKSDLAFYYKRCINGLDAVKRQAWQFYRSRGELLKPGELLSLLRLIKECEEARFSMLQAGPSTMALKALEEKMEAIERETAKDRTSNSITREAEAA
jgi:DNA-binding transcriptional ArsR family regulator